MAFFSAASFNVRGLRNTIKRAAVFDFLCSLRTQFCFVQEVHLKDTWDVGVFSKEWRGGKSLWSVGGVHATGVGILFGMGVSIEMSFVIVQGRAIGADVKFGGVQLRVICIYGPQAVGERAELFKQLETFCATNRCLILGGDFNCNLVSGDTSVGVLKRLMSSFNLMDAGKGVTPRVDGPTWRNTRGVARRLDYVLVSRSLGLLDGRVVPAFFSDHDGVLFRVRSLGPVFGKGYWKMNMRVLQEEGVCVEFGRLFRGLAGLRPCFLNILEWWEVVKERVRTFCILYGKRRARKQRAETSRLQGLLEFEYSLGNQGGKLDVQVCEAYKAELKRRYEDRARDYLLRSRRRFVETNEKCLATFFSSVRAEKEKKVIPGVRDSQGIGQNVESNDKSFSLIL